MFKKLLVSALALALVAPAMAAKPTQKAATKAETGTVYSGQNGAKAIVFNNLKDGMPSVMGGENFRYLCGAVMDETGFVYDFEKDTLLLYPDFQLRAYFSPTHYVAAEPGKESGVYIMYNGNKLTLDRTVSESGLGRGFDDDLTFYNAQPNGDHIVMMGYECQIGENANSEGGYDTVFNHVGAVYNGKTGKLRTLLHSHWPRVMPLSSEENVGYGSRAFCISADGKVLGGHATWPTDLVFSNNQTTFWDLADFETSSNSADIHTYAVENEMFSMSDLQGVNSDGSVLVGYNEQTSHGLIIYYNRTNKTFTIDTIEPLAGWQNLSFSAVDDNGLILGHCGMDTDPGTRLPVVYTRKTGLMSLESYLYEYYDINIEKLFTPISISANGKAWAGYRYENGYTIPWMVKLGDQQILPRPRKVTAKAATTGLYVRLNWMAPLASEHTLTGYKIYRDNGTTPIATVAAEELTYLDNDLASAGKHTYQIEAVYGENVSGKSQSNVVQTILEGGYFPVQEINHQIQYNRYASIYWGLPSSEVTNDEETTSLVAGTPELDLAPMRTQPLTPVQASANAPKSYTNANLDYVYNIDMKMYNGYCGIKIGNLYYVSSWKGGGIQVFDQNNEVVKELAPRGLNHAVLSMVYLPGEKRLLCGGEELVSILNLETEELVNNFSAEARHMAYLPDFEFEGKKGVLLLGSWTSGEFYTLEGEHLGAADFNFDNLSVSGTAYHGGKLYVASQTGPNQNEVYVFDVATRAQVGGPVQVSEDPAVYNLLSSNDEQMTTPVSNLAAAGGLTIDTLDDGTIALGMGFQCNYVTSRLMFLELESAPERRGYTLYRNDEVLADGLTSRRFHDEITAPGTYIYRVKAVADNKESELSPATTIVVPAYGDCPSVQNIKAREVNRWVTLNWNVSDNATGIVGFTIFRNEQQLKRLWNKEVSARYTDFSTLEVGKEYTYRIETLYQSGCVASDSVKITIADEGVALPPYGLRLGSRKNATASASGAVKYDVAAAWETPLFEEPLSIGYGTGEMITGASFGDGAPLQYYAAVGWDTTDIKLYQDLYLVGMEYMLGDDTKTFTAFVMVNDTVAYAESLKRTTAKSWQTMYFKKSVPMNQPREVVLGYYITFAAETAPVALDFSYNKPFFSDIISFDGAAWYSLNAQQISASWCIRGLVARKRDIDEAKRADGTINYDLLKGKVMALSREKMPVSVSLARSSALAAQAPTKAPLTLEGFNIYRQQYGASEEVKLNSELLKGFYYQEAEPLPAGEYDYTVEAVYGSTTKRTTAAITLEEETTSVEDGAERLALHLYPNPAAETVYVNGSFDLLQIMDLSGRVVRRAEAGDAQIDVSGLTPGTYFFHFVGDGGRKATYKVMIR